ncbi:MAG: AarF/ABC1/UbiB kinase family protein [Deltaproteobacteria bacterium]|nr:AarF/ABC1/UbiB kinase family protein [Deltaproteobacteria bacterium]
MTRASRASRPPRPRGTLRFRLFKAYWVTFQVIWSYLSLKLLARFLGHDAILHALSERHLANAKRVEHTILELQGLFIKVGQLISIMTNFLPEEFRRGLEGLQDQVPPRPYEEIDGRIREEFGEGPDSVFREFDREPIASASLGQVHRARLKSGEEVAVKVQHLDIDEIVRVDLKAIRRILGIVRWFVPIQGLDAYYSQIREMILAELDFDLEARHIERIAANFVNDPMVSFPKVYRELSTHRVLVTSFVNGVKISDVVGIGRLGVDRKALAERVLKAYCQMIFVDGVYHADPHPGNILARPDGGIVFLDFGAVAVLSTEMKEGITQFLEGVIGRDTEAIARSLRRMGFIARHGDTAVSERVIEYFHRRFQEEIHIESLNLKDIKIDPQKGLENIADFRKLDIGIRELTSTFRVPKDWVLLERTVLLLTGLCTHLDPEMNPMTTIRPYLEEFVFGKRDFGELMLSAVKDMALGAISIPDDIKRYLAKAMRGDLEMRFRGMRESTSLIYALGHQLIYTLFALAGAGAAYLFDERAAWTARNVALGVSGWFLLALVLSMLGARRFKRRS